MEYQTKQLIVDASPWNQNGDHPDDNIWRPFEDTRKLPDDPREGAVVRYFRHPGVDGNATCAVCHRRMNDHGWIDTQGDGRTVCPGDWIITNVIGDRYPCKNDLFEATFEPL